MTSIRPGQGHLPDLLGPWTLSHRGNTTTRDEMEYEILICDTPFRGSIPLGILGQVVSPTLYYEKYS